MIFKDDTPDAMTVVDPTEKCLICGADLPKDIAACAQRVVAEVPVYSPPRGAHPRGRVKLTRVIAEVCSTHCRDAFAPIDPDLWLRAVNAARATEIMPALVEESK